jgi:hypothetical protein
VNLKYLYKFFVTPFIYTYIYYLLLQAGRQGNMNQIVQAAVAPGVAAVPVTFLNMLIGLGLSELAANKFINSGVTSLNKLRTLMSEALDKLIKQIHRDNQGQGLFIPFFSFLDSTSGQFTSGRITCIS